MNSTPVKNGIAALLLGATVLLLPACASREGAGEEASRPPPVARPGENGEPACFFARQVQDFRAIGRADLVVFAPNENNAYQVRIAPPATGLRFSDTVAFVSRGERICGYAGDDLVIDEAGGTQRYSVVEVARLTPETVDRLLGRTPAEKPGAEARPGAGAEVERQLD